MKSLLAFFKKELLCQLRSGSILVLGLLFLMLGILNPAVAKLTPWLLEMMADNLAESGMSISLAQVSAMDSWVQFFKNLPIALIAFVLIEGGIFTKEYSSGTLILSLTKGVARYKVLIAKGLCLVLLWTLGYWLCFGVTYAYNAYFWDNAVAQNLLFSAFCWWVFGVTVLSLIVLFSVVATSLAGVLLGCGATVLLFFLVGLLPRCAKYLPTFLSDGNSLIYGALEQSEYFASLGIGAVTVIVSFALGIVIFNKKAL